MASLNSCSFIGNLGKDPEVRSTQGGDKVASLSIACSESWKDRNGERKERTTWVPVVIWGPLAEVVERYLRKGSKIFVCGKFSVRKWQDRDGNDRYSTEIVLQGPQAQLVMLDGAGGGQAGDGRGERDQGQRRQGNGQGRGSGAGGGWGQGEASGGGWGDDPLDDDIPFVTSDCIW